MFIWVNYKDFNGYTSMTLWIYYRDIFKNADSSWARRTVNVCAKFIGDISLLSCNFASVFTINGNTETFIIPRNPYETTPYFHLHHLDPIDGYWDNIHNNSNFQWGEYEFESARGSGLLQVNCFTMFSHISSHLHSNYEYRTYLCHTKEKKPWQREHGGYCRFYYRFHKQENDINGSTDCFASFDLLFTLHHMGAIFPCNDQQKRWLRNIAWRGNNN